MTFEVGEHYKRADGEKALCVYVWGDRGVGLFVLPGLWGTHWVAGSDGVEVTLSQQCRDIIGEWKEPRKWTVCVVECVSSGGLWATMNPVADDVILARHTITEGDGT
jgi:hypothetical protein